MMEYKGYLGSVEYSDEDEALHGRLEFIRDLVLYESADAKGLKAAFHEAVEDYLELCEAENHEPDVPLKGSFSIRSGRELRQRATMFAHAKGRNLNSVAADALRRYLDKESAAF